MSVWDFGPPWNRRVVIAVLLLAFGVATFAWHRNPFSGGLIEFSLVALAVWYGDMLGKGGPPKDGGAS